MGWKEYRGISVVKVKDIIKKMIKDKRKSWPLLLLGPPGIGKSEIAIEALEELAQDLGTRAIEAKECTGKERVVYHRIEVPFVTLNDLKGMPKVEGDHYSYLPPKWVKALKEAEYGLLILDDITETTDPHLTFVASDIAFTKCLGDTKFDKPVIATGNPKEFSILAESTPFNANIRAGRIGTVMVSPASVLDWHKYMLKEMAKKGLEYDGKETKFLLMTSYFGVKEVYELTKVLLLCDDFYIMTPEFLSIAKSKLPTTKGSHNLQTPRSWTASVISSAHNFFLPEYVSSVYREFVESYSKGIDKGDVNIIKKLIKAKLSANKLCYEVYQKVVLNTQALEEEDLEIHEKVFETLLNNPAEEDFVGSLLDGKGNIYDLASLAGSALATLLRIAEEDLEASSIRTIDEVKEVAHKLAKALECMKKGES